MVLLSFIVVVLLFGFVVFFGAPYVPTRKQNYQTALDLLALKKGETLLELGCGDGRVLKAAALRGLKVVGYELNPVLVLVARLNTRRYRRQVRVIWGNYWMAKWPPADGIFYFGLPKLMPKLHQKIIQLGKTRVKLASFAFTIDAKKPLKTQNGIFLYQY